MAEAIFEAALPRQAGDILPVTVPGILVAVADRLDSIVGLIAAVGPPSATADPFALRRAAYGMLAVRGEPTQFACTPRIEKDPGNLGCLHELGRAGVTLNIYRVIGNGMGMGMETAAPVVCLRGGAINGSKNIHMHVL